MRFPRIMNKLRMKFRLHVDMYHSNILVMTFKSNMNKNVFFRRSLNLKRMKTLMLNLTLQEKVEAAVVFKMTNAVEKIRLRVHQALVCLHVKRNL